MMKTYENNWHGVLIILAGLAVAITGCGGGSGGGGGSSQSPTAPSTLPVTFEYQASTNIDPGVDFETCTDKQVRFTTHLHFTWNDWEDRRYMVREGDDLFVLIGDVPVGRDLTIALHDPNNCLKGDPYIAPESLFANGQLLFRPVRVAEGIGLAFRHETNGTITP